VGAAGAGPSSSEPLGELCLQQQLESGHLVHVPPPQPCQPQASALSLRQWLLQACISWLLLSWCCNEEV
jgi:hypothetical protein